MGARSFCTVFLFGYLGYFSFGAVCVRVCYHAYGHTCVLVCAQVCACVCMHMGICVWVHACLYRCGVGMQHLYNWSLRMGGAVPWRPLRTLCFMWAVTRLAHLIESPSQVEFSAPFNPGFTVSNLLRCRPVTAMGQAYYSAPYEIGYALWLLIWFDLFVWKGQIQNI